MLMYLHPRLMESVMLDLPILQEMAMTKGGTSSLEYADHTHLIEGYSEQLHWYAISSIIIRLVMVLDSAGRGSLKGY